MILRVITLLTCLALCSLQAVVPKAVSKNKATDGLLENLTVPQGVTLTILGTMVVDPDAIVDGLSGGGVTSISWGHITGTLSSQTDLRDALAAKLAVTTAASTYAPIASPTLTGTTTVDLFYSHEGVFQTPTTGATPFKVKHSSNGVVVAYINDDGVVNASSFVGPLTGTASGNEVPITFSNSLSRSGNTVTLTNDSTTPGANKIYGTNSSGVRGWFAAPTGGGTVAWADITGAPDVSGTNTGDVTLAGAPNYLSITGQVITLAQIDLTSHVTGVLPNANTTATSLNTASKIVTRDASGNFAAGTITGALAGNASTATALAASVNINGVAFNGSSGITVPAAAGTLSGTALAGNVASSSLTSAAGGSFGTYAYLSALPSGSVSSATIVDGSVADVDIASAATWNAKQDALGFTPVPNTRTVNGHALSANVTITTSDLGMAAVATSGAYADLSGAPSLGSLASLSTITSTQITDGTIVNADISGTAAIALSKLATDPLSRANHTGTQAWSTITGATTLSAVEAGTFAGSSATTTVGVLTSGTWNATAIGDAYISSAATWNAKQSAITFGTGVQTALGINIGTAGSVLVNSGALGTPQSGNLANCTFPTLNQSTSGNAATATALATAVNINGVSFNGLSSITVAAAAGTLTGTTLASNVTASSLTSAAGGAFGTAAYTAASAYEVPLTLGTGLTRTTNTVTVNTTQNITKLSGLTTNGAVYTSGGDGTLNAGTLANSYTTATSANTASAIVARDASGNFTAGNITAALNGTASGNLVNGGAAGTPSSITLTNGTGLPIASGVSGLGTGVATALAVNTGSSGSVVVNGGAGGTPSSITLTNATFPTLNQNTTGYSSALKSATTTVDVSAATAPSANQVLTATDSTHATWQTPSGGGSLTNFTEAVNTTAPNATIPVVSLTATNAATNVDAVVAPKGTGGFALSVHTGTAGTGNKLGAGAVDLQTTRGSATQVASGDQSFVAGYGNTASAQYTVAMGYGNIANTFAAQAFGYGSTASNYYATAIGIGATSSGQASIALGRNASNSSDNGVSIGYYAAVTGYGAYSFGNNNSTTANYATSFGNYSKADRNYMMSFACGNFSAVGDAQNGKWVLRAATTNATPTEAFVDGASVRLGIPANKAISGTVLVLGKKQSSASVAKYRRCFTAVNNAGTSILTQSETLGTDYEDNASCDFTLTVSDPNDAVVFTVTGITSENWHWTIWVDDVEVSY